MGLKKGNNWETFSALPDVRPPFRNFPYLHMVILIFLYLNMFSIIFVGLKCESLSTKFEKICLINRYGNSKGSFFNQTIFSDVYIRIGPIFLHLNK